jgi:hypothetical protein
VKARLVSFRIAAPLAIVVAFVAYSTFLYSGHEEIGEKLLTLRSSQSFGADSVDATNAIINARTGTIQISRSISGSGAARWVIDPRSIAMPPFTIPGDTRVFVSGLGLALGQRTSRVIITLGGRPLATLLPNTTDRPPPFGVRDPPIVPLDIPPIYENVLEFDVPQNDVCVTHPCALQISTEKATWIVNRVGLLKTGKSPGAALWAKPSSSWELFGLAAVVALFVHLCRSVTLEQNRVS